MKTPTEDQLSIATRIELHLCRWAFVYVLVSYLSFSACNVFWLNWKWKNGDAVYDVAMCVISFFWLGMIAAAKAAVALGGVRLFSFHAYAGGFWARLGASGYGISISDKSKNPPLFSERNGHRKVLRVGRYGFEILNPF